MPKPVNPVYGWRPQQPDSNDLIFSIAKPLTGLPASVDLRGPNMPDIWDQGQLGSCFPAGTFIRMADGSQRKIEDVKLLDEVVTAEGNTGSVYRTMVRFESDGLYHIKLWGSNLLKLTGEHPILTKNGYVKANEIKIDDWVAITKYTFCEKESISTFDFISRRELLIKTGNRKMGVIPGRSEAAVTYSTVPEVIELTPGFGKIIGFFLSEGSCDSGKLRFTFSIDEELTLVKECVDLFKNEFGIDAYVQKRPNNSINVVIYGTAWPRLFEKICGNGSGNKRLHSDITSGPIEFKKNILEGWLQGDGWYGKRDGMPYRRQGVTVSHELALNMYDIAQCVGYAPSINFSKPVMNAAAKTRRDRWTVEMGQSSANYRVSRDEKHNWRRVRAIEKDDFAGFVYNLSVHGDESYVAEGIGVHNCTAHGIGRCIQYAERKAGLPDKMPSRLFLYYNERSLEGSISQDAGAVIRDGFKACNLFGVADESLWPYDISKFTETPTQAAYDDAKSERIHYYASLDGLTIDHLKQCLAHGYPFAYGFNVYANFEEYTGGVLQLPTRGRCLGGHCVTACGYDDSKQAFLVANSWGEDWASYGGYFYMSYDYMMSDLVSDKWMVRLK
jgi:intein/homing endonuclease